MNRAVSSVGVKDTGSKAKAKAKAKAKDILSSRRLQRWLELVAENMWQNHDFAYFYWKMKSTQYKQFEWITILQATKYLYLVL